MTLFHKIATVKILAVIALRFCSDRKFFNLEKNKIFMDLNNNYISYDDKKNFLRNFKGFCNMSASPFQREAIKTSVSIPYYKNLTEKIHWHSQNSCNSFKFSSICSERLLSILHLYL